MKNFEVQPLLEGLVVLKDVKLPGKISYAVIRNTEKLSSVFKSIDESRKKLAESLSEKDENGEILLEEENGQQVYKMTPENKAKFQQEYASLLEADADLELYRFDEKLIESIDEITLEQMSYLTRFTKE
jgi:hypothetical protein